MMNQNTNPLHSLNEEHYVSGVNRSQVGGQKHLPLLGLPFPGTLARVSRFCGPGGGAAVFVCACWYFPIASLSLGYMAQGEKPGTPPHCSLCPKIFSWPAFFS